LAEGIPLDSSWSLLLMSSSDSFLMIRRSFVTPHFEPFLKELDIRNQVRGDTARFVVVFVGCVVVDAFDYSGGCHVDLEWQPSVRPS
jgi:hypothetical protein